MMNIQMPPMGLLKNTSWATPAAMRAYATYSPNLDAMRVARSRLRLRAQTIDRNTRPPSSGKPGSMLKAAITPLMKAK